MVSKVDHTTHHQRLDSQMEEDWMTSIRQTYNRAARQKITQIDKQQTETPNSQVNDIGDLNNSKLFMLALETAQMAEWKISWSQWHQTSNHHMRSMQYNNGLCTQTGILGNLIDGKQCQSLIHRDIDKGTCKNKNIETDIHRRRLVLPYDIKIISHHHYPHLNHLHQINTLRYSKT